MLQQISGEVLTSEEGCDSHPALSHVLTGSEDQDLETSVERIDAVVKQLAQRTALLRPPSLATVDGIESLVQEQAEGPAVIDPAGAILVEGGVVPQQGEEVDDDEHEAREGDEVGRHAHRKALDDHICVKGLEDVFRGEGPIDARVLVFAERGEIPLTDVHHLGRFWIYRLLLEAII